MILSYIMLMASSGEGGSMTTTLLFMASFFAVIYFFMIRPQSKKAKDQKNFLNDINKGDRIVTIGGIHGKVLRVDERTLLVEVDSNTKLRIEKSVISMEYTKASQEEKEKKSAD